MSIFKIELKFKKNSVRYLYYIYVIHTRTHTYAHIRDKYLLHVLAIGVRRPVFQRVLKILLGSSLKKKNVGRFNKFKFKFYIINIALIFYLLLQYISPNKYDFFESRIFFSGNFNCL